MESLLCNEVWLMSPNVEENDGFNAKSHLANSFFSTKEDFEEAFGIFLGKEARFLPEPGYLKLVETDDLIRNARFKAVCWIIKSQRRMDLSLETVFTAVNYLDRFISRSQCKGWRCWMFELLSVACLSIASKFNETTTHLLYEFQDDLENSFSSSLIQRMELTLLKALGWRMGTTTPFSYIDLMIQSIDPSDKTLVEDLTKRVIELLLDALLDPKFLEFQQCVIAMSAVRCVLEDFITSINKDSLSHIGTHVIPQEQKDDLIKCQIMMEKLLVQDHNTLACANSSPGPASPVTVLEGGAVQFLRFSSRSLFPEDEGDEHGFEIMLQKEDEGRTGLRALK